MTSPPSSVRGTLLDAASHAAGAQQYPAGTLYVVATPIGNLADLSLRAIHVLGLVDALACEDTRTTGHLLAHLGLRVPLIAVHEHNEREAAAAIVARLQGGHERIAVVSDAGTPAISDPGARLVAAVRAAGLRCIPVPGASAVATALSVAGDALGEVDDARLRGFRFVGFLPPKGAARRDALQHAVALPCTVVLYESPHRVATLADELAACAPSRTLSVARELTKQFETVHTLAAADLPAWLAADAQRLRGEFVLVLHALGARSGVPDEEASLAAHDALLDALLEALPLKHAVDIAVRATGVGRKHLYARALQRKGGVASVEQAD
jgi:16S rRNA (cytidine1402-2'-O)-methyltransferase